MDKRNSIRICGIIKLNTRFFSIETAENVMGKSIKRDKDSLQKGKYL